MCLNTHYALGSLFESFEIYIIARVLTQYSKRIYNNNEFENNKYFKTRIVKR